jgi:hypothetical protein
VVWDKDRRLPAASALRATAGVTVCEPALAPSPGAVTLLFPVADDALDAASPANLAAMPRPLPLAYIGNQYGRDAAFSDLLAPAAARHPHRVAGKWASTAAWPHVTFTGRIPFPAVRALYESALTTILLLPPRYAAAGQMTQRIFEAVLAGCLPLTPAALPHARAFTPQALHVTDGRQAGDRITWLQAIAGTPAHAALIAACLARLDMFRLSRQLTVLDAILRKAR